MLRHLVLLSLALTLGGALTGCSAAPSGARRPLAGAELPTTSGRFARSPIPELVNVEVGGMMCSGCATRVKESLRTVPGVHRVDVNLDKQRAIVLCDSSVADTALTAAVRRAGSEFVGFILHR